MIPAARRPDQNNGLPWSEAAPSFVPRGAPQIPSAMSQITVEKTAEDSASKSLRVTVPVDRVREAEAKAAASTMPSGPGCRVSARARPPRPSSASGSATPSGRPCWRRCIRESWETAKTAESLKPITDPSDPQPQVRGGQPDRVRAAGRGPARDQARAHRAASGSSAGSRAVPDSAVDEQLARLQEQKATWIPVEGGKPAPGQMVRVEVAPHRGRRARAPPSRTTWSWARTRRSRSSRSGSWRSCRARPPRPRCGSPTTIPDETRRGQTRRVRVTLHEVKRQELPAARRRLRPRGRRLRDPRRAARGGPARTWSARPRARPTPQVRQALIAQVVEANNVAGARSRWCTG